MWTIWKPLKSSPKVYLKNNLAFMYACMLVQALFHSLVYFLIWKEQKLLHGICLWHYDYYMYKIHGLPNNFIYGHLNVFLNTPNLQKVVRFLLTIWRRTLDILKSEWACQIPCILNKHTIIFTTQLTVFKKNLQVQTI